MRSVSKLIGSRDWISEFNTFRLDYAASVYSGNGFKIFPTNEGEKTPHKILGKKGGFQKRSDNYATAERIWKEHPEANIAICPGDMEMVVLDVDIHGDKQGMDSFHQLASKHPELARAPRVITPSGGMHIYLMLPEGHEPLGNSTGSLPPGIDVRSSNGYVLIPPSCIGEKRYQWRLNPDSEMVEIPADILQMIKTPKGRPKDKAPEFTSAPNSLNGVSLADLQQYWEEIFKKYSGQAVEGSRSRTCFDMICQLRDNGASESDALAYAERYQQQHSSGSHPYTWSQARQAVLSCYRSEAREPTPRKGQYSRRPLHERVKAVGGIPREKVLTQPQEFDPAATEQSSELAREVILAPSKRDAMALRKLGLCAAACNSSPLITVFAELRGRDVIIWPKKSEIGEEWSEELEYSLSTQGIECRMIRPEDHSRINAGHGPLEFLQECQEAGFTREDVGEELAKIIDSALTPQELLERAEAGAFKTCRDNIEEIIGGSINEISWPGMLRLTEATHLFRPGAATVLWGAPGAAKSFLVLELFWQLERVGVPVSCLMLEDDKAFHLGRMLAQKTGFNQVDNISWIRANKEQARSIYGKNAKWIERMGKALTCPEEEMTKTEVLCWVWSQVVQAKKRIVIIDPITAAEDGSQKPWDADRELINGIKKILRRHRASALIVTHPRDGQSREKNGLDGMAGGRAWSRFSHTVLYLEFLCKDTKKAMMTTGGKRDVNRALIVDKARNGAGTGMAVGAKFNDKFRYEEMGYLERSELKRLLKEKRS